MRPIAWRCLVSQRLPDRKNYFEWHKVFCWLPRLMEDHSDGTRWMVWLEHVERRRVSGRPGAEIVCYWEYRWDTPCDA